MSLPGYDEWKERLPREYDAEDPCPDCGCQLVDAHECRCGWNEYEAVAEPEWCHCARVPGVPHAPKWCAFLKAADTSRDAAGMK